MKNCLIVLVLLLVIVEGFSQSEVASTDKLRSNIQLAPDDTAKVWLYEDLYLQFFLNKQMDSLMRVAEEGLSLSQKLGYKSGLAKMNYYMAKAFQIEGASTASLLYFKQVLNHLQQFEDVQLEAKTHLNMGAVYYFMGDLDLALKHYFTANEIYEQTGKQDEHARLLNNIGVIYKLQGKYGRAKEIYQQSYAIKEMLDDSSGMAASLMNIGLLYNHMEDGNEDGISYLQRSLEIYEQLSLKADVAGCNTSLGGAYVRLERWKDAKKSFLVAWEYYKDHPEKEYTAHTLKGLGEIAEQEGDLESAETYYFSGVEVARKMEQKNNLLTLLLPLSEVQFQMQKNKEAYKNLEEAYSLQAVLYDEQRLTAMEEMQAKFDLRQKVNELTISELELSERTKQRNLFRIGALFLAIVASSVFFGLRSRIKMNKAIAERKETIQLQRINQLEQEKKLTALSAMLEGEERERSRIANDLHDGLGGLLTAVKSYFGSFANGLEQTPHYNKTNQLIDEACVEVRRISHNMMPRSLALSGLTGALQDLASDIRQKGLNCELEIIGLEDVVLSKVKTTNLYRIVQELTNNVLKHAKSSNLLIQLICQDNTITVIVEDDGVGFDHTAAHQQKGLGLSSIKARVEFLAGQIHWDAVLNEGTTVSIKV